MWGIERTGHNVKEELGNSGKDQEVGKEGSVWDSGPQQDAEPLEVLRDW